MGERSYCSPIIFQNLVILESIPKLSAHCLIPPRLCLMSDVLKDAEDNGLIPSMIGRVAFSNCYNSPSPVAQTFLTCQTHLHLSPVRASNLRSYLEDFVIWSRPSKAYAVRGSNRAWRGSTSFVIHYCYSQSVSMTVKECSQYSSIYHIRKCLMVFLRIKFHV